MSKGRSRIVVFVVGIVLCLLLLEVSLRVVGAVYSRLSEPDSSREVSDTTILCLGDSVTFGLGAKRGFSYPDQLQKMLDQSDPQKQYRVINRGWPGQNSAQLLLRVEGYLREFRPQIVTLLTGARNQDNFFGFRQFLEKSGDGRRGFLLRLHDSLDTIRLYKFTRLLFRDLTTGGNRQSPVAHKLPEIQPGKYPSEVRRGWAEDRPAKGEALEDCFEAEKFKEMGQYDKALEFIQDAVNREEVQGSCYYLAGSMYLEKKQYPEAVDWFQKGIHHDPLLFGNYDGIGLALSDQGKMEDAITWFQKGFTKARYESLYGHCYIGISKAFRKSGDTLSAIRFFKHEVRRPSPLDDSYLNRLAADYLLLFQKRRSTADVLRWIQSDIGQLLDLLKKYDIKIVFQNYPYEPDIDAIYQKIGSGSDVIFVDHQETFSQYTENGVLSREFFVPDGHPNAAGYHLMAKNLWAVITSTRERN